MSTPFLYRSILEGFGVFTNVKAASDPVGCAVKFASCGRTTVVPAGDGPGKLFLPVGLLLMEVIAVPVLTTVARMHPAAEGVAPCATTVGTKAAMPVDAG